MKSSRREFIKQSAMATAGTYIGAASFSAKSYGNIIGANDRVRVGVVGFSDRFRSSLLPAFAAHHKKMNFDMVAVSDIWRLRREAGQAKIKEMMGHDIKTFPNNDALYDSKEVDAVIISTADFQHALHGIEAVKGNCDAYIEKPFAETMADARAAKKAIKESGKIIQIGSQRRSGTNYHEAAKYIADGKFGDITMVELTWNVNQPGRWRRLKDVAMMKEADTDWARFQLNRPKEPFSARKHLEFRLFWPYSSGLPGQWMSHQIDTVHWFSGISHPRSCVANGGIYAWKDGRENWDTITAVFDYGPESDPKSGFQVTFASRMHNGEDAPTELYYSKGGEMNLDTNMVSSFGGLTERHAKAMNMEASLLPEMSLKKVDEKVETGANTGVDALTSNHMLNWMECVRSRKQTNAPVEAGYSHAIAVIMANAAARSGTKVIFDEATQEVMAGDKPFTI